MGRRLAATASWGHTGMWGPRDASADLMSLFACAPSLIAAELCLDGGGFI